MKLKINLCAFLIVLFMRRVLGAFDFGSGAVKLTIAQVCEGKTEKILYGGYRSILVAHAVQQSGGNIINQQTVEKVENAMKDLMNEGEKIAVPKQYSGIATAIYRETQNGSQVVQSLSDKFQFHIEAISQELEGYLGFLTAAQSVEKEQISSTISWDTGGASFQLVSLPSYPDDKFQENMKIVQGHLGSSKVTSLMIEEVQNKNFVEIQTTNPASTEDCDKTLQLIKLKLSELSQPDWITKESQIVGIGGITCAFNVISLITGLKSFNRENVISAIEKIKYKNDSELQEFPEYGMIIPKMLLVLAVMEYFRIEKVTFSMSNGSTTGMFLYPNLWDLKK